jgi:20S proteasome subunit beta 7
VLSRFDPFWNSLVVAGMEGDKPFVGMVSMIGVKYIGDYACTGFANHLALPLIREGHRRDMSEAEAVELVKEGLKVRFTAGLMQVAAQRHRADASVG